MTLREALDSGAVRLETFQRYNRKTCESKPVLVAREVAGERCYWEVSQKITG